VWGDGMTPKSSGKTFARPPTASASTNAHRMTCGGLARLCYLGGGELDRIQIPPAPRAERTSYGPSLVQSVHTVRRILLT
jgi:hypothetical protein